MIKGLISIVLGAFFLLILIVAAFTLLSIVDTFERKVSYTKIYKAIKMIMNILGEIIAIGFLIFVCWGLGDSLISTIIGG